MSSKFTISKKGGNNYKNSNPGRNWEALHASPVDWPGPLPALCTNILYSYSIA